MSYTISQFLSRLKKKHPEIPQENIVRAFSLAENAHRDQRRATGEPYITHPIAVASILLEIDCDEAMLIAALLHDTVEDTDVSSQDIQREFGDEVQSIVDGLTKITKVESFGIERQVNSIRKMFLAMANDLRVIFIKLADRLHNMQTLHKLAREKKQRIAKETLSIYAPIATRLGIYFFKEKLEDLCFKVLHPTEYKKITQNIAIYGKKQNKLTQTIEKRLNKIFSLENAPNIHLFSRVKQRYSIFKKMQKRQETHLENIYDVFAVRIITDTVEDCYKILGIIHKHWTPLQNRIKDYIAVPKFNGYQSLHTTVLGLGELGKICKPVEIQIRTQRMHDRAEKGLAAHWAYKEGKKNKQQWIQSLAYLAKDIQESSNDFLRSITTDPLHDRIFVLTPKGDVKDLAEGSTPIDFAYAIHSDLGNHIIASYVNGKSVALSYNLHHGDIVEIKTDKNRHPNPAWINTVKTNQAKSAIKNWLRKQSEESLIKLGREEVNTLLKKLNRSTLDSNYSIFKNYHKQPLSLKEREVLLVQIGEGKIKATDVIKSIFYTKQFSQSKTSPSNIKKNVENQEEKEQILVLGETELQTRIASCCKPSFPQKITGYITRGGYISIHKVNCPFVEKTPEDRFVECHWANEELPFEVEFNFKVQNITGVIADMLNFFAKNKINLLDLDVRTNKARNNAETKALMEVKDLDSITWILKELKEIHGVIEANYTVK